MSETRMCGQTLLFIVIANCAVKADYSASAELYALLYALLVVNFSLLKVRYPQLSQ